ncbi:plasmid mobilization protein [Ralstonia pseudosolanacearum]
MTKLFTTKDEAEKRSKRIVMRVTAAEELKIKRAAAVRQMDVSEFARRAALGRKADVDHETEAVLALSAITREVRAMHAAMLKHGITPPEADLLPVILEARQAILRVSEARQAQQAKP